MNTSSSRVGVVRSLLFQSTDSDLIKKYSKNREHSNLA
jgi:hypothetical protein